MDRFCTKETHNRAAPSKQNYFCNGLSAVEVINQHDDFKFAPFVKVEMKTYHTNIFLMQ